MKYSLTAQHIELSSMDRQLLDEKLNRLQKLLDSPSKISVVIRHDTHHRQGKVVTCTLNIEIDRHHLYAERAAATVQDALDDTLKALKQELLKHHDKHRRQQWSTKRWPGRQKSAKRTK